MWGQPPPAVRAERSLAGFMSAVCRADCRSLRRALLARTAGGGCPHMTGGALGGCELWQVFPEEFAAIDNAAAAHVKQVHGEHAVFVVVAEDICVIAFGGGDALAFL